MVAGRTVTGWKTDRLKLETLAPLAVLDPGATVEHVERWYLFRDVPRPESDKDVERWVLPLIFVPNL